MRVTVVHNLQRGGARRRLASQIDHLDCELTEVCPETAEPVTAEATVIPMRLRAQGASRALRPPLRYVDQRTLEAAWHEIAEVVNRSGSDVVYANPCRYAQAPLALGSICMPTLYFCDEPRRVDYEEAGRRSRRQITAPIYGALYRRQRLVDTASARAADEIVTNSAYTAHTIMQAYGHRADVIPMGVPDQLLVNPKDAARPAVERTVILSVGTLIATKGHEIVIRAVGMAARRRPVVLVAPRDDPSERARLSAVARAAGVDLQIRIAVSDEELRHLYCSAHATCYMARREPFGLVALEAQACGSPVIVSDEGGLPETITAGVTGWATVRQATEVAGYLNRLDATDVHSQMSAAAMARGRSYTWEASAREVGKRLSALADRAV